MKNEKFLPITQYPRANIDMVAMTSLFVGHGSTYSAFRFETLDTITYKFHTNIYYFHVNLYKDFFCENF